MIDQVIKDICVPRLPFREVSTEWVPVCESLPDIKVLVHESVNRPPVWVFRLDIVLFRTGRQSGLFTLAWYLGTRRDQAVLTRLETG